MLLAVSERFMAARVVLMSLALAGTAASVLEMVRAAGGGSSVVIGVDHAGVRGLVAGCHAQLGDVLLEVPLAICLADCAAGDAPDLPGSAPAWAAALPWNVQLAANALSRRGDARWRAFLASWPAPPVLPKDCELEELVLAGDASLQRQADEACFWLDEQYWAVRAAAEALGDGGGVEATAAEFSEAMAHVWSRCLKLTTDAYGVRRFLVPLLDMANHDATPTALYAYAPGASCGPAIRLHAARALAPGDPVSITYGAHTSAHFALYYGFVPRVNPFDRVDITVGGILGVLPEEILGDPPDGGWEAAIAALPQELQGEFGLKAAAPADELIKGLCLLFLRTPKMAQEEEGMRNLAAVARSVRVVAVACTQIREMLLCGLDTEDVLRQKLGELSERGSLLLEVRLSRLSLLSELRERMERLAAEFEDAMDKNMPDGGGASQKLLDMQCEAKRDATDCYPELDRVPVDEMASWGNLAWDWQAGKYVS